MIGESFGLDKIEIYESLESKPEVKGWGKFFEMVESRKKGTPLQYVIGHTFFRGLKINVCPQVLIPRPETEMLVELALKELKTKSPKVLDLCCGSGCIACSVVNEVKDTTVVAIDVSSFAIECTKTNIKRLGFEDRIKVVEADMTGKLPIDKDFDMIICNPPYVPNGVYEKMPKEVVDFEPSLALRAGEDGLKFLPDIISISKTHLKKGGTLALELFEESIDKAAETLKKEGLENIKTFRDLANKDRFVLATI